MSIAIRRCCSVSFSCSSLSFLGNLLPQPIRACLYYLAPAQRDSLDDGWQAWIKLFSLYSHCWGKPPSYSGISRGGWWFSPGSYSPASLQWRHLYWRLGHLALCFRNSLLCTFTIWPLSSLHSLGQGTKVKSQPVKCSLSDCSSPVHSQPSALLSQ